MKNSIQIGKKIIGDGYPTFIIAEMAWSHDGSVKKAKRIIKGAAEAGANAIGFHITSLKDYMVKNYGCLAGQTLSTGKEQSSIYNYLDKINLKDNNWRELFPYAKNLGLIICAMPNDIPSLKLCQKLKPDAYVIAAACFGEEDFVVKLVKQKKPIFLRIGGASLGEIENIVNLITRCGTKEIILLHGIQLYPTRIGDTHLKLISSLKKLFSLPVGLADHIDANSELALIIPLIGISEGANVIEKHITHDRSKKGEDFEAALNPDEFKKLVFYIRETEKALGSPYFRDLSPGEIKYREVSRKRTVAMRDIKKNEKITQDNITFKRADEGVYPNESKYLIGRIAKEDIKKDEPIIREKLL